MLLNTVKHANASQIGINIMRDGDLLRICISDNGCGFDVMEAAAKKSIMGGFGLINVQHRIEYMGGSVTIISSPGQGTRVTITAPLEIMALESGGYGES
jgi:signal transduction histidine kinase